MAQQRQFKGVFLRPEKGTYRAVVDIWGERTILGDFDHPIDAAIAYDAVASLTDRERNFPAGIISRDFMALARQKIREAKKKHQVKHGVLSKAQMKAREAKRLATNRLKKLESLACNNAAIHVAGRAEVLGIELTDSYREIAAKLGVMTTDEHWSIVLEKFDATSTEDRTIYMRAFAQQCQQVWNRRRKREAAAAASVADSTSTEPSEVVDASNRELSRPMTLAEAMQLAASF